jgi:hypothetical protein
MMDATKSRESGIRGNFRVIDSYIVIGQAERGSFLCQRGRIDASKDRFTRKPLNFKYPHLAPITIGTHPVHHASATNPITTFFLLIQSLEVATSNRPAVTSIRICCGCSGYRVFVCTRYRESLSLKKGIFRLRYPLGSQCDQSPVRSGWVGDMLSN